MGTKKRKNDILKSNFISKSETETKAFAAFFLQQFGDYHIVCLKGELGSGKTTFAQGIAEALGIRRRIISPTFILMRNYPIPKRANVKFHTLIHIDAYRIHTNEDILGLTDISSDPTNFILIEWPDNIKNILPEKRIELHFFYHQGNEREIKIRNYGK